MNTREGIDLFTAQAQACNTFAELDAVRNTLQAQHPELRFFSHGGPTRVILRVTPADSAYERSVELGRGDLPA